VCDSHHRYREVERIFSCFRVSKSYMKDKAAAGDVIDAAVKAKIDVAIDLTMTLYMAFSSMCTCVEPNE